MHHVMQLPHVEIFFLFLRIQLKLLKVLDIPEHYLLNFQQKFPVCFKICNSLRLFLLEFLVNNALEFGQK